MSHVRIVMMLLSRVGAPAWIVSAWLAGAFELVVSETLLRELERALACPKLARRVSAGEAAELVALLRRGAALARDPPTGSRNSADPGDDYLLALAEAERAILVSGDRHLLALGGALPIRTARAFVEELAAL